MVLQKEGEVRVVSLFFYKKELQATKVDCGENDRIIAISITNTCKSKKVLLIYVYMPNNNRDGIYSDVIAQLNVLICIHNTSNLIIFGDMNVTDSFGKLSTNRFIPLTITPMHNVLCTITFHIMQPTSWHWHDTDHMTPPVSHQ